VCPLCGATDQWIKRHLRAKKGHNLSETTINELLLADPNYRRRGATNPKPRVPCIIAGCTEAVTHMGNHLRRHHKTTALAVRNDMKARTAIHHNGSCSRPTVPVIDAGVAAGARAVQSLLCASAACSSKNVVTVQAEINHEQPYKRVADASVAMGDAMTAKAQCDLVQQLVCTSAAGSKNNRVEIRPDPVQVLVNASIGAASKNNSTVPEMCPDEDSDEASDSEDSEQEPVPEPVIVGELNYQIRCIIDRFRYHLGSMDGGAKATPEIYSLGVKQILNATGNSIQNLTKENVLSVYVQPLLSEEKEKRISVKTVRNKLASLEKFCDFMICHLQNSGDNPVLIEVVHNMTVLKQCLPKWRTAMRKKCKIEDVVRRLQDCAEQLSQSDIVKYLNSNYAQRAVRLLSVKLDYSSWTPSMTDFNYVRNHMIAILELTNAHRSGVLMNFSLDDYK